jgi:hypothetical protein
MNLKVQLTAASNQSSLDLLNFAQLRFKELLGVKEDKLEVNSISRNYNTQFLQKGYGNTNSEASYGKQGICGREDFSCHNCTKQTQNYKCTCLPIVQQ